MEELKNQFDQSGWAKLQPHEVQYSAGQRDVYKYCEMLVNGDLINER